MSSKRMQAIRAPLPVAVGASLVLAAPVAAQATFGDVRPILEAKCASCHGATEPAAGLRLDDWGALIRGSNFGEAVIAFPHTA